MKLKVTKFQEGGQMTPAEQPAAAPAPAMEGQMSGEEQLAQIAGQVVQSLLEAVQDPNMVMQILEMALQMVQEAAGQGQPIFKCGGKLVKKAKKASCGAKMAK